MLRFPCQAAQDFVVSLMPMGISQLFMGPTYEKGRTLDLVFSTKTLRKGVVSRLEDQPVLLSDHCLVKAKVHVAPIFCREGKLKWCIHGDSCILLDTRMLWGFQTNAPLRLQWELGT